MIEFYLRLKLELNLDGLNGLSFKDIFMLVLWEYTYNVEFNRPKLSSMERLLGY